MATSGSESDEIISIKCCVCTGKGRKRDAEKYCTSCNEYYCSSCVEWHSSFEALKKHQLLDKANFGSGVSDTSLPSFPTERCSLHPGKIVDMFCKDHDDVACATCINLSHRTCTNISYIPEEVNHLYNRQQLLDAREKLNTIKNSIAEIKRNIEAKTKELKDTLNEAVESVNAFVGEIKELVDNLAHNTVQELKAEFDRVERRLKADLDKAETMIHSVDETVSKLRRSEGNAAEEFVCVKSSQTVMTKAEEFEVISQKIQTDENISFTADASITSFLKQIKSVRKPTSSKYFGHRTTLYKVKKKRDVDIKVANEGSEFWIFGSCITEDSFLLLTDFHNMKLKRVDLSTEILKDYVTFQANPWGVCQINKTEAAVCLKNQSIQFVTLADTLTVTRTITFDHECFGLAHTNSNLVISDRGQNVYIYNKDGQRLQKISPTGIFSKTRGVAVSDSGDRIFIVDFGTGLIILDMKGNNLSSSISPIVSGVYDVCTDGSSVFVCGCNSNNVVQIGQDYKVTGEIAKVTYPLSLSFDRQNSRLIITNNSDKLTVIELE